MMEEFIQANFNEFCESLVKSSFTQSSFSF